MPLVEYHPVADEHFAGFFRERVDGVRASLILKGLGESKKAVPKHPRQKDGLAMPRITDNDDNSFTLRKKHWLLS